uniref:Uncharacterized protein n=1 Tax=Rangifer tarandus platyrhynchus TaxID=3082113 RepID=A0ACB0EW12_RANTA|nr:unnamed protein product [Rangifer tarandus platyrhynchus]
MATAETMCHPDEYEVPGNPSCSRVCPAGYHVSRPISQDHPIGACSPCESGTFRAHPSVETQCMLCAQCREDQEVVKHCSPTSDQECQCRQGKFFCDSVDCTESCIRCARCEDSAVLQSCNATSDTVCATNPQSGRPSGPSSEGPALLWPQLLWVLGAQQSEETAQCSCHASPQGGPCPVPWASVAQPGCQEDCRPPLPVPSRLCRLLAQGCMCCCPHAPLSMSRDAGPLAALLTGQTCCFEGPEQNPPRPLNPGFHVSRNGNPGSPWACMGVAVHICTTIYFIIIIGSIPVCCFAVSRRRKGPRDQPVQRPQERPAGPGWGHRLELLRSGSSDHPVSVHQACHAAEPSLRQGCVQGSCRVPSSVSWAAVTCPHLRREWVFKHGL